MIKLELSIPPVVVMLIVALIMWITFLIFPEFSIPEKISNVTQIIFIVFGVFIIVAGIVSFRRAGTTVNPMKPDTASSLVITGIYKITRNPMYLGVLFLLIGWGLFLSNIFSCLASLLFVFYMNHFQIKPEERALELIFGEEFINYKSQVRRWL